jgi:hypothetical protein
LQALYIHFEQFFVIPLMKPSRFGIGNPFFLHMK